MKHLVAWCLFLAAARLSGQPCAPSPTKLCLNAERFAVSVSWKDFQGNTGTGQAVLLTSDTGYFWFFSSNNVELIVKVLDARALNGRFWVFYGALSNVEYTMTVTDTTTGRVKTYTNPSGTFASVGDTDAFSASTAKAATSPTERSYGTLRLGGMFEIPADLSETDLAAAPCPEDPTSLYLSSCRFRVSVSWKDFQDNTGQGQAVSLTSDTGYFWFFNAANVELVAKVLDARALNGSFWVFYGALSNVEYEITVTDTTNGQVRRYLNPAQRFGSAGDTQAFPPNPSPAATAVGVATGSATIATIGAAGGSVSSPDGRLALTIPPGALASNTVISIEPITNMAHGKIGSAYRLTPEGQSFLTPVTLKFTYTDQDLEGTSVEALGIAFQTAAGFWQWAGDAAVDTTAKTVSIGSSHFSDWSNVKGDQIHPSQKTVMTGRSVRLKVVNCYERRGTGFVGLGYKCGPVDDDEFLRGFVEDWKVNGVLGGGEATGTVSDSGHRATYTAPATKPSSNVVVVSARLVSGGTASSLKASLITILGDKWTGTASSTSDAINATAQVTWTLESFTNDVALYRPNGSVSVVVRGCSINPSSNTLNPATDGLLVVDFKPTLPTYGGKGASLWFATYTCPGFPGGPAPVAAAFFGGSKGIFGVEAQGTVDVETIKGSDTNNEGVNFNWDFTNQ